GRRRTVTIEQPETAALQDNVVPHKRPGSGRGGQIIGESEAVGSGSIPEEFCRGGIIHCSSLGKILDRERSRRISRFLFPSRIGGVTEGRPPVKLADGIVEVGRDCLDLDFLVPEQDAVGVAASVGGYEIKDT